MKFWKQQGNRLAQVYYTEVAKKRNLKKHTERYPDAARIHERLLRQPKTPRKQTWILNKQIDEEL